MTTSIDDHASRTEPVTAGRPTPGIVPSGLLGGIGGLVFAMLVVIQNAIRSGFPAADASAPDVATYYATHRGASVVLAALFPLGALGIVLFLAALVTRVAAGPGRAAGLAGAIGGTGIAAGFTAMTATDVALAEYVHRSRPSATVVDALWVLHNASFATLLIWVGITLAALTAGAAATGLLSDRWKPAGLLGGLALLATGGAAFGVLGGSPVLALGLAGFAVWLAFTVVTSIVLLRDRQR